MLHVGNLYYYRTEILEKIIIITQAKINFNIEDEKKLKS